MSAGLRYLLFAIVIYGTTAAVQWGLWRWLHRALPRWLERRRKAVRAVLVVLFVMPMTREASFFFPRLFFFWPFTAGFGLLWHLTACLGLAGVGLGYALSKVLARPAGNPPVALASPERRQALERLGGAVALSASGAVLGWGAVRGRFEWSVVEVPIKLARLPRALDGFTIVQISDIHVGPFVGERELDMGLSLVRTIRADLIAITGDIIDADPAYVPLAAAKLGRLSAREGVVCVPGNHEYHAGAAEVMGGMRRAGIDVLLNRGKVVAAGDGGLAVLGVDDLWARDTHMGPGPDLARAKSTVRPDLATVLLAHQPRFVKVASAEAIDLQLSGHTHGGQINPGFRPIDLFFSYVAGRYDVGATQLYVNRGFGTVGPPARVGAPPEITKIVLVAG